MYGKPRSCAVLKNIEYFAVRAQRVSGLWVFLFFTLNGECCL